MSQLKVCRRILRVGGKERGSGKRGRRQRRKVKGSSGGERRRERERGEGRECIVWLKPQKVEGKTKSKAKQNKAKRRKKRLKQQRNIVCLHVL